MKKNGFTLLEIIISLALLTIIGSVSFFAIKSNSNKVDKNVTNRILNGASIYIDNEKDDIGNYYSKGISKGGEGLIIPLKDLVNTGYINKSDYNIVLESSKNPSVIVGYFDESCDSGASLTPNWEDDIKTTSTVYFCSIKSSESDDTTDLPLTNNKSEIEKNLLSLYKIRTDKPDFKIASPQTNKEVKKKEYMYSDNFTDSWKSSPIKLFYPIEDDDDWNFDSARPKGELSNVSAYISSSYAFDNDTGKFSLNNSTEGYLGFSDFIKNTDDIYICDNLKEICDKKMYKVKSWSWFLEWTTGVGWSVGIYIVSANVYNSMDGIDSADSGLYRDYDDDGYTYYFRGGVNNNYVRLKKGNSSYDFRIMRFNGDGTIRLLSTEPAKDTNGSIIKGQGLYEDYSGKYPYTDSTLYVHSYMGSKYDLLSDLYFESTLYKSASSENWYKNQNYAEMGASLINSITVKSSYSGKSSSSFSDKNYITLADKDDYNFEYVEGFENTTSNAIFQYCKNDNNKCKDKYVFTNFNYYDFSRIVGPSNTNTSYNNYNLYKITATGDRSYNVNKVFKKYDTNGYPAISSDMKKSLDLWYSNNMKPFDTIIVNSKFCNDTSYNIVETNVGDYSVKKQVFNSQLRLNIDNNNAVIPTFSCPQKKDLISSKVGLFTADELVYAGAGTDVSSYNNYGTFFLEHSDNSKYNQFFVNDYNNNLDDKNNILSYSVFSSEGSFYNSKDYSFVDLYRKPDANAAMLPVINILGNVKIDSATGSKDDPFVIDVDKQTN